MARRISQYHDLLFANFPVAHSNGFDPDISIPFEWNRDVESAQALLDVTHKNSSRIANLIPDRFATYCGLLHPFWYRQKIVQWHSSELPSGSSGSGSLGERFRELKAVGAQPVLGSPSDEQAQSLIEVLKAFTSTPDDCSFLVWEGYAALHGSFAPLVGKEVRLPAPSKSNEGFVLGDRARRYYLRRSSVDETTTTASVVGRSLPDFFWPQDMTWFVASDMDLPVTYIGGPPQLAAALEAIDGLDIINVDLEDEAFFPSASGLSL